MKKSQSSCSTSSTACHSSEGNSHAAKKSIISITHEDLPLACPRSEDSLWSLHPRVFLPIEEQGGKVTCPYCSTVYQLT
jgi:uncharacterized Zn-finger protein